MRLLLVTHIFLWAAVGSASLKAGARRMIREADAVFVSAASLWEIAIKARLGKLQADPDALVAAIDDSGFIELPVRAIHAAGVAKLPGLHKDPFDRLLIAQSMAEPLRFLTADTALKAYGDLVAVAD
jgi:PIN domain nuclease of toxin-antitoxin system